MEQTSSWATRYKGSLDSILNCGDFAGSNLQALTANERGYTPDGFHAGTSKFYNGNSGEVAYKTMQFLGGYSYGKEKRLVKKLARKLGCGWWIFGWSANYGHYEGDKFVKGKPQVEGTKATYTIKDTYSALSLCTGGRKAEVQVTIDRATNLVDVKYVIKPEKRIRKGQQVVLPVHEDVIHGYLNKIYKGFAKSDNLQFKEVLDAQRQPQPAPPAPAQQEEQPEQPAEHPEHPPAPAGG